jgi:hypothetical protein
MLAKGAEKIGHKDHRESAVFRGSKAAASYAPEVELLRA